MMTVQETTFKGSNAHYNMTYILSDDRFHCLGYIPQQTLEPVMFKNPLKFSSKGRTFKTIKAK